MRARSLPIFALALACALGSTGGCKRKKTEVTKDDTKKTTTIPSVPRPSDVVVELVVRDPEAFAKRTVDAAGLSSELGPSPYEKLVESRTNESEKMALRAIDPHAPAVALLIGDPLSNALAGAGRGDVHGVVAVRVKDASVVDTALRSVAKAHDSKTLGKAIFEFDDLQFVLVSDVLVASDKRETLESAAKYAAYRLSSAKIGHEAVLTVAFGDLGVSASKRLEEEWSKSKSTIPPKSLAAATPIVTSVLGALLEAGDGTFELDLDGDALVETHDLRAKGQLAKWIAALPTGDANALLSLPQGSAAIYRFPDDLAPLVYAASSDMMAKSPLTAAERADFDKALHTLGASLGHELAWVTRSSFGTPAKSGFELEYLLRFDLTSAPAAKGAMETLRKLTEKPLATALLSKPTTTPYKKFSADGETTAFIGLSPFAFTLQWAVAGSGAASPGLGAGPHLYLDVCWPCTPKLVDAALDPSAKGTLGDDAVAKAKISTFPSKGVIGVGYGDDPGYRGFLGIAAGMLGKPKSSPATSGYTLVSSAGVKGKGWMPLASLGEYAKTWLGFASIPAVPPGPPIK